MLLNGQGRPWTSDGFKKTRAKATTGERFARLHFHDLRGTAVTMLSERGSWVQEIASNAGHSLAGAQKILDSYLSRTRHIGEIAIAKLEIHPRNIAAKRPVKCDV